MQLTKSVEANDASYGAFPLAATSNLRMGFLIPLLQALL
jgi:hypothetical protein